MTEKSNSKFETSESRITDQLTPDNRLDRSKSCIPKPELEQKATDSSSVPVQLVTVKDVQRILSIGRTKSFQLMARGALERRRIDGCTRITLASVMSYVEAK